LRLDGIEPLLGHGKYFGSEDWLRLKSPLAAVPVVQCCHNVTSKLPKLVAQNKVALKLDGLYGGMTDRNRCADPGDLKCCIFRSRPLTGGCNVVSTGLSKIVAMLKPGGAERQAA
jgi:hypothetical protein